MPYIKQDLRFKTRPLPQNAAQFAGELNYRFTCVLQDYLARHGESYQTYNDIVGALECCKLEVYRRKVARYEDDKIIENGDVYEPVGPRSHG